MFAIWILLAHYLICRMKVPIVGGLGIGSARCSNFRDDRETLVAVELRKSLTGEGQSVVPFGIVLHLGLKVLFESTSRLVLGTWVAALVISCPRTTVHENRGKYFIIEVEMIGPIV
jgi:hypothetical protein